MGETVMQNEIKALRKQIRGWKVELPDLSFERDAIAKLEKRVGALEKKLSKLRKRAESYLEE